MATAGTRQTTAKLMLFTALLSMCAAAVIYAGIVPIGDARVRSILALSIAAVAVIDAVVGIFYLTRS